MAKSSLILSIEALRYVAICYWFVRYYGYSPSFLGDYMEIMKL